MDFQVTASYSPNLRSEFRLGFDHLDDIGFGVSERFPDSSPEHETVVYVHHDPLVIQRILVHRDIASWVCAGDVTAFGNTVGWSGVRMKLASGWRRR